MSYVLRQISPRGRSALAHEATAANLLEATVAGTIEKGDYLEWSDPDAAGGLGDERWTSDLAKAKRFPTWDAAMECWKAQSKVAPVRPDGLPNRPLTAWSVTVEKLP